MWTKPLVNNWIDPFLDEIGVILHDFHIVDKYTSLF